MAFDMAAAVAAAKAKIAERQAAKDRKEGKHILLDIVNPPQAPEKLASAVHQTLTAGEVLNPMPILATKGWLWNEEQESAIRYATERRSFCLIGAAGTGKTTTLKGCLRELMDRNLCAPLEDGTDNLAAGAPGIVLVSYTRRAVRNIIKQMPDDLKGHCLTIHKLLQFAPEFYEKPIYDEDGSGNVVGMKNAMRFVPTYNKYNKLPENLLTIVVDESSMVNLELFQMLLDALPNPERVQFIILGDLNQLPPVYGNAILGKKLLELPIIELTRVYRQALESPIISLALSIKNNNFRIFEKDCKEGVFTVNGNKEGGVVNVQELAAKGGPIVIEREGRGKVTLHPWKQRWDPDQACAAMMGQIGAWITAGAYSPDEDLILCPWEKGDFGCKELNLSIANKLGLMRKADVYEVIAGFNKYYLAVGDKLMIDKQEALVTKIEPNHKYTGTRPGPHSPYLNRWGVYQKAVALDQSDEMSSDDIDDLLESLGGIEERTAQASHTMTAKILDTGEELKLSGAAEYNGMTFGYAITVHKAQGSECRRVFFITHYAHSAMLSRELTYTAITRAAEELYIVMSPMMLGTAAKNPRIKGDTLQAKLAWYSERLKETQ